jgi:DNA-directed RNA polymerase specialized sigma24 family protein
MSESLQTAKSVLDQYSPEDWKNLRNRLRLFAHKHFGFLSKEDIEDVVSESIIDTYTGRRTWKPSDQDLFFLMCGVVRSKVSHLLEKANRTIYIEENLERAHSIINSADTAEQMVNYKELCSLMLGSVPEGRLSQLLQMLMLSPDLRPRDISKILNRSIKEVRNDLRRLRRNLGASVGAVND